MPSWVCILLTNLVEICCALVILSTLNANAYKTNTTFTTKHTNYENNVIHQWITIIRWITSFRWFTQRIILWWSFFNSFFGHKITTSWCVATQCIGRNEIITFHAKNYYHTFTINSLDEHKSLDLDVEILWNLMTILNESISCLCWLRWESPKMKDLLLLEHQNLP